MEISVVMPNYNHGRFLNKSISALMDQKLKPKEIFIFDDASTDESVEIIKKLQHKYKNIELSENKIRQGVVKNCQSGLSACTTEFVYFAAADDFVHEHFFSETVELLKTHKQAAVCSTKSTKVDQINGIINVKDFSYSPRVSRCYSNKEISEIYKKFGLFQNGNSTIYRREHLEKFGGIPDLGPYSDGVTILLLSLQHGACFVPEELAYWRISENSYSSTTSRNIKASMELIKKTQNFIIQNYEGLPIKDLHSIWRRRAEYHLLLNILEGKSLNDLNLLTTHYRFIKFFLRFGSVGRKTVKVIMLILLDFRGFMTLLDKKLFQSYD